MTTTDTDWQAMIHAELARRREQERQDDARRLREYQAECLASWGR